MSKIVGIIPLTLSGALSLTVGLGLLCGGRRLQRSRMRVCPDRRKLSLLKLAEVTPSMSIEQRPKWREFNRVLVEVWCQGVLFYRRGSRDWEINSLCPNPAVSSRDSLYVSGEESAQQIKPVQG